jgi:GxxExxY protein
VHKALGPGFLECVYQKGMEVALRHRSIGFDDKKQSRIFFEDEEVGLHKLNLIVDDQIIVELKAAKALEDIHYAQLKSYLKATRLHIGLLLNFNATTLVIKRVVLSFTFLYSDSPFRVFVFRAFVIARTNCPQSSSSAATKAA